jgi:hypothetical protein
MFSANDTGNMNTLDVANKKLHCIVQPISELTSRAIASLSNERQTNIKNSHWTSSQIFERLTKLSRRKRAYQSTNGLVWLDGFDQQVKLHTIGWSVDQLADFTIWISG